MRPSAFWLLLMLLGACSQPPTTAPAGGQPVAFGAVGPVPGPTEIAPSPNPLGLDHQTVETGRRLFVQYNCYGCHGGHAGGGMGPSLRDPIWLYGSSPREIFNSIAQGRAHGMPTWGTRITAEQIWQMTAYIQTLGTADEAEPPK